MKEYLEIWFIATLITQACIPFAWMLVKLIDKLGF